MALIGPRLGDWMEIEHGSGPEDVSATGARSSTARPTRAAATSSASASAPAGSGPRSGCPRTCPASFSGTDFAFFSRFRAPAVNFSVTVASPVFVTFVVPRATTTGFFALRTRRSFFARAGVIVACIFSSPVFVATNGTFMPRPRTLPSFSLAGALRISGSGGLTGPAGCAGVGGFGVPLPPGVVPGFVPLSAGGATAGSGMLCDVQAMPSMSFAAPVLGAEPIAHESHEVGSLRISSP